MTRTERDKKSVFQICYFTLIGIGVAVLVHHKTPGILKFLSRSIKSERMCVLMLLVAGLGIVVVAVLGIRMHYQLTDKEPVRKQMRRVFQGPTIPLWIKLVYFTGNTMFLLGVVGLILVFLGVPIGPGFRRVWGLGVLPWIFLLGGVGGMVLLCTIYKKLRRATKSNYKQYLSQGQWPQWVMALGLMMLAAIAKGIWMIAAAFFD